MPVAGSIGAGAPLPHSSGNRPLSVTLFSLSKPMPIAPSLLGSFDIGLGDRPLRPAHPAAVAALAPVAITMSAARGVVRARPVERVRRPALGVLVVIHQHAIMASGLIET